MQHMCKQYASSNVCACEHDFLDYETKSTRVNSAPECKVASTDFEQSSRQENI